jgi:hypothetical protein
LIRSISLAVLPGLVAKVMNRPLSLKEKAHSHLLRKIRVRWADEAAFFTFFLCLRRNNLVFPRDLLILIYGLVMAHGRKPKILGFGFRFQDKHVLKIAIPPGELSIESLEYRRFQPNHWSSMAPARRPNLKFFCCFLVSSSVLFRRIAMAEHVLLDSVGAICRRSNISHRREGKKLLTLHIK